MAPIYKGNQGIYKIYGHDFIRQNIYCKNSGIATSSVIHNSTDSINDNQDRRNVEMLIQGILSSRAVRPK